MCEMQDPSRAEVAKAICDIALRHVARMLSQDIDYELGKGPRMLSFHSYANRVEVFRAGHLVLEAMAERDNLRDRLWIRKIRKDGWWKASLPLPRYQRGDLSPVAALLGQERSFVYKIREKV